MNTSLHGLVNQGQRRKRIAIGFIFSIVFLIAALLFPIFQQPVHALPATFENPYGGEAKLALQTTGEFSAIDLSDFVSVGDFVDSEQIVAVYAAGLFTLPVVQQPQDRPWFVSSASNTITQFALAGEYGSLGFLAHNTLAGSVFYNLEVGQEVRIILGDGTSRRFIIEEIMGYQALDPDNPYSSFRPAEGIGKDLSSTELFNLIYAVANRAVFQTCIEKNGDPNWGRYFVIAYPVREHFSLFDLLSY
jgi:hypothetical protein